MINKEIKMKNQRPEKLMNEKGSQVEALADLPVADEQADRAIGGGAPSGRIYVGTQVGVFI
jgi:hypothetical protein